MNYNGSIYRPPIEAHTMLIPVTEGCIHNKCTFRRLADSIDRVYLVGADPFALSAENLLERISLIKKYLPNVAVITM